MDSSSDSRILSSHLYNSIDVRQRHQHTSSASSASRSENRTFHQQPPAESQLITRTVVQVFSMLGLSLLKIIPPEILNVYLDLVSGVAWVESEVQ